MKCHVRKIIFALITGILISFCYVAGYSLDTYDTLTLTDKGFYLKWFVVAIAVAAFSYVVWMLIQWMNRLEQKESVWKRFDIPYGVCVALLFLCWLPTLLSIFPGAFSYDALNEWEQVKNGLITAHHPVIHVLLLGGLVEGFHSLTGSYNVGIAVYSILQMFLMANVFAMTISFMKEFKIPKWFRMCAILFYGFSPVVQLFSICATKDVFFSGAELIFFLYVLRLMCDKESFFERKRDWIGFCVSAFLTMIMRNNGLYVVLIMLVVLAWICRKYWKKFALMLLGIMLPYMLYVGPVYSMLHVTPGGVEEMLSVPLQQMARVYRYDNQSLEAEDIEFLYQIVPQENLEAYRPTVSDFVKNGFKREFFEQNKIQFLKLWLKWGMENPLTYMNSFLVNTVDFWYPGAIIDGYRDPYGKSSYFDYQVDEPGTETVLLQGLHDYYAAISHDKTVQEKPLVFLVLSPGWYLVVYLFIFLYMWCHRKYHFLIPMLIFVVSVLTVLLGPIALVRYVLVLFYALPVVLSLVMYEKNYNVANNEGIEKQEVVTE